MPTYRKPSDLGDEFSRVPEMAKSILHQFASHAATVNSGLKIDFVFAFCDRDEDGNPINNALSKSGVPALGICRKVGARDRAKGNGDAEISLDADWWGTVDDPEREALLDHELHHIAVVTDRHGNVQRDDLKRPKIRMRKHDFEMGWFKIIAERHGIASQECKSARHIMDSAGQLFLPDLFATGKTPILAPTRMQRVISETEAAKQSGLREGSTMSAGA